MIIFKINIPARRDNKSFDRWEKSYGWKKKVTGGKRVKYLLMATVGVQKLEALVFSQKRHRETGQTQIRLLLKKQSDLGLPCLLF